MRVRADRGGRRAAHRIETFTLAQLEHAVEALGVTRDKNQQRIGIVAEQLSMGRQDDFVLAFMGAGRNPHRALLRLPLLTQRPRRGEQLRVDGQIEFDRTGHLHTLGTRAQLTEALGFGFGLHRDQAHFFEHGPGEFGETRIAFGRTGRKPGIGQRHGDPALGALVDVVGPQLGFHDDDQFGLHPR